MKITYKKNPKLERIIGFGDTPRRESYLREAENVKHCSSRLDFARLLLNQIGLHLPLWVPFQHQTAI